MRIGIDISQLAYPNTGVGVYTRNLVKQLLAIDRKIEYVLFGSSLRRQEYLLDPHLIDVHHFGTVRRKIYPIPISLLEILWNNLHTAGIEKFVGHIDLFHTSDWVEPPSRAKKVTTIHDLLVYKYPQLMHPRIVANQRRKLTWVKKESVRIIADSENTKRDAIELLGIKEKRIKVIYLGVEKQFAPQPEEITRFVRHKYGLTRDYILAVGTIEPRKNISRVTEVYKELKKDHDLDLVIVGQFIWGNVPLVHENIKLLRNVDQKDLPALYGGAKCFVYPSLYEGFGLPVLDAMASGCPVVTSSRGSLKEVAGKVAVIVDPESSEDLMRGIKSLLSDPKKEREQRVLSGIAWAKNFTWEKTARETLAVYKEIVS